MFERMLGYELGETFGRDVFDLVHPDDQVSALEGFESTVSSANSRRLSSMVDMVKGFGVQSSDADCEVGEFECELRSFFESPR